VPIHASGLLALGLVCLLKPPALNSHETLSMPQLWKYVGPDGKCRSRSSSAEDADTDASTSSDDSSREDTDTDSDTETGDIKNPDHAIFDYHNIEV
jgi:hypothetical protein